MPTIRKALVGLPHQEALVETTELGGGLDSIHENIISIEEKELLEFLDINGTVMDG